MYSHYVNVAHYINLHIAKEATQSSRIEGTRTEVRETFLKAEDIAADRRADWEEVQNYIEAMNFAVEELTRLPYSSRLFRKAHELLLQGVRGQSKMPGEFRQSQNWIGGATINDARHVPPPHNEIGRLMSDLEHFANDPQNLLPNLLKIGIIHYQFETIHPFLDGNGRVGRLMITLFLVDKGILRRPILYLSDFLEKHRQLYYDNLSGVRGAAGIEQWLKFFLTGVIQTAQAGIATFDGILQLERSMVDRLAPLGNRISDGLLVVNRLYEQPVLETEEIATIIGKSRPTASRLVSELSSLGVLKQIERIGRRNLYAFQEYIDLFA